MEATRIIAIRHGETAWNVDSRIQGHLDRRWAAWFDGLSLTHDPDGTTLLEGRVADQAALHGLLTKVRDMGLPLVSVTGAGADAKER